MRYLALKNDKIELIRTEFQHDKKNPHRVVAVFNTLQELQDYYDKYLGGDIDYSEYDGCTCSIEFYDEHGCPFREEINDDYESMCNCCPACTHACAMDI